MRFTADDAFDLRGTEDAIILDRRSVDRILCQHGTDASDMDFSPLRPAYDAGQIDAGDLFALLGY